MTGLKVVTHRFVMVAAVMRSCTLCQVKNVRKGEQKGRRTVLMPATIKAE